MNHMETIDSIARTKTRNETFRQKVLRSFYPVIKKLGSKGKNGTVLSNENHIQPTVSFYKLNASTSNGSTINFSEWKGRKVLLVNTASDCGYTAQYAELQSLYEKLGDRLVIIAFPANDFAQEDKSNDEITQFCKLNYGVTFPVALKGTVLKTENQQPVFRWLTDKNENGWNDHAPDWNFSKYLISEEGTLTHYIGPSISPLDTEFLDAIKK